MNRKFRKDVKLEGIPLFWYTNLTDEEIKEFYEVLKGEPDDPMDWEVKVSGFPPSISPPPLFSNKIAFKHGWCECYGFLFCFRVTYRSAAEWELWEAREREIAELREEQHNQYKINQLLFETEDKFLSQSAKDMIERKEFENASKFLQKRMEHANLIEQKNRAEGFRHFNVVYHTRRDCLEIFKSFQINEYAIRFLKEHCKFAWDFYLFGKDYFFANWQEGKAPVEETDKIFRAAVHHFPQEGKIHKSICLFWEREKQIDLAVVYCRLGCDRGLRDNTQKGFPFRLKRLLHKAQLIARLDK